MCYEAAVFTSCRWVNTPAYKLCYICGCLDVCHCVIKFALHVVLITSIPAQCVLCMDCESHHELTASQIFVCWKTTSLHTPLLSFSGKWTPPSSSSCFSTSFLNQTNLFIHLRANKAHDLWPAWDEPPDESLLHLVLCCWLHLPTGIAPTHSRLCPPAIHSDFVQLVNLASSPCWKLRQREKEEEKVGAGLVLRNEGGIRNLLFYV